LLRIRLSRVGKKKQPAYRLIVADSRSPRDGAFLKIIGHYNPLSDPATLVVKEEEAVYWLEKGARPSETVAKLLTRIGVMERAGKAPVRYEGKEVAPAPKKEAKEAAPAVAVKGPPAEATAKSAAPEVEESTPATDEAEATTEAETPAEAEALEAQTEGEEGAAESEAAGEQESEAKEDETETEPDATNDEQSQEPAENQE
jgi:small subunit ribosomal protein S16